MTTIATPAFTKDIRYNRANRDYDMFLDGQYIGSRSTHHQAEIDLDQHAFDLLSDGLCFTASELDGGSGIEEIATDLSTYRADTTCACGHNATIITADTSVACAGCYQPPAPIACICGKPALIIEPHGTFCGACWEAQGVWVLWKNDAATFVWMLRQQRARLNELAERLAT